MERRRFLETLAVTGGFAWLTKPWLAQGQDIAPAYQSPVPLVADSSLAGLSQADLDALFQAGTTSAESQVATFPQSVASGDPNPNGVILWTRIESAAQAGGPLAGIVAWQIASAPSFASDSVLIQGISVISASADNTVKIPVQHSALQPFTQYYYRFLYNQVPSRTGSFKTLPAPGAALTGLCLGYIVCQDYGNGYYNALRYLAQEQLDYVIHLGDYIYETIDSNSFQNNPARIVPGFPSGSTTVPQDVTDYRHLYKVYRSDPDLQSAHERFAFIQLWDDHEFANDCHQDFHPDNNTAPNTADTPQPALRQAANRAWAEYGLADVKFDAAKDWETSLQVYRKFIFGTLADLIVTDERLYRDGPPCGNDQSFQRHFSLGCAELQDDHRTMLGSNQLPWFLNQVTQSPATWKLWANEVMLMQLKAAGLIFVNLDQWDGYPKERSYILRTVRDANVKNFVALTGDLHTFLAGYLKPDFNNLFQSPVGVELMVGSISSANLAEELTSAVHLPSAPVPAKNFGLPPNALDPMIRLNNPHIRYWNSSTHGYGILDITPTRLQCTFKAVTTIRSPEAGVVTLKNFTVPAGSVRLIES